MGQPDHNVRQQGHERAALGGRTWATTCALRCLVLCALLPGCLGDLADDATLERHLEAIEQAKDALGSDSVGDAGDTADPGADAAPNDAAPDDDAVSCSQDADCIELAANQPCVDARCDGGTCLLEDREPGAPCQVAGLTLGTCEATRCNASGGCVVEELADGSACDGVICGKKCDAGLCVPATAADYDDGNPCTIDACDQGLQITHAPITDVNVTCDDGDPCTTSDACAAGVCAGKPTVCDDGIGCTLDSCVQGVGCAAEPIDSQCDDGDVCTVDVCDAQAGCGTAGANTGTPCDDGKSCTQDDVCVADGSCQGTGACGCKAAADCAALDLCKAWTCEAEVCVAVPDSTVACPGAAGPCAVLACDPATGLCAAKAQHEGKLCDDGDPCSEQTACASSVCAGGATKDCDDANPCTADACEPGQGCVWTPSAGAACDDDNPCTVDASCAAGGGCAGLPKDCDDGVACTLDGCEPDTGACSHIAQDAVCDDGSPCTDDVCASLVGCQNSAVDGASCSDGDACTANACIDGACKVTSIVCECSNDQQCEDGEACTADICQGGICENTPTSEGLACDPSQTCVLAGTGTCVAGACTGGTPVDCSALGDACSSAACNPATGACAVTPKQNGLGCDADGDPCTVGDACTDGNCLAGSPKVCSGDPGACQVWVCEAAANGSASCVTTSAPTGTACDDGDTCTVDDACDAEGQCGGGADVLFDAVVPLAGADDVQAALATADGGRWLLSNVDADKPSLSTAAPRVVRLDASGALVGESTWSTGRVAFDLVDSASGVWLVGGKLEPGSTQTLNPWWATADASGQPGAVSAPDVGFGGKDDRLVSAAALGQGVIAVGSIDDGPAGQALLMQIDANGTQWKTAHGPAGQKTSAQAVAVADGTIYVSGWQRPSLNPGIGRRGWLAAFTPQGGLVWERDFSRGGDDWLSAVVVAPAGDVYAAGAHQSDGAAASLSPWLLRTTAEGTLHIDHMGPAGRTAHALTLAVDNGQVSALAWAGPVAPSPGAKAAAWWATADPDGNEQDGGTVSELGSDVRVADLTFRAGTGIDIVGTRVGGVTGYDPWLRSADAFGHTTCASAAGCWTKSTIDCADGKACTRDSCSGGTCGHTVVAGSCQDGSPCTVEGLCGGLTGECTADKARLGVDTDPTVSSYAAVVAAEDNTALLFGADAASGKPVVQRVSAAGNVFETDTLSDWQQLGAAARLPEGDVLVGGSRPASGGGQATVPAVGRRGADGAFAWLVEAPAATPTPYTTTRRVQIEGNTAVALQSFSYNPLLASGYELSRLVFFDVATGKIAERDLPLEQDGVDLRWRAATLTGNQLETWVVGSKPTSGGTPIICALVTADTTGILHTVTSAKLPGSQLSIADAVHADDGGFFFVGRQVTSFSKGIWFGRVSAAGTLLWEATSGTDGSIPDSGDVAAGLLLDGGTLVVAGSFSPDPAKTFGWFGRFAPDGTKLATSSLGWGVAIAPVIKLHALASLGHGFALVGAGRYQGGPEQGLLYRTDAWGHGSCATAAGCAGLPVNGCDDGDPTTADSCTSSGCQHLGP